MAGLDVASVPTWYLERAINDTVPGLQNFVRDLWLAPSRAARYQVGAVLRSPGPVEATSRVGGMRTSHRIAILSNHMADLSALTEEDWGLHAAASGSRFQVVDVSEHAGKTQITLLHLPDDERWRLFDGVGLSVIDDLVPGIRERFAAKCVQEPIAAVSSDEWLTRMHDPVGLDDGGEPYPVEVPIAERIRPLSETDFRDVAGHLLYVRGAASVMRMDGALPDCVCWGYLDHERGLCLNALCDASLSESGEIKHGHALDKIYARLEFGSIEKLEAADLCDETLIEFPEPLGWVHDRYAEEEKKYRGLRDVAFLDQFRSKEWPDDVQAFLFADGLRPELVWLRLEGLEEAGGGVNVYARLLNEPSQDCPVHEGDLLPLTFQGTEDGTICLAIPEKVG